jgi:hypothetical protein
MGFGYLFIGYLFATNPVYSAFTAVFGVLILSFGVRRLSRFNLPLRHTGMLVYPMLAVEGARFVFEILRLLSIIPTALFDSASDVLAPASTVLLLLFHERLCSGIEELAIETELPKVRYAAKRNRLFAILSYALSLAIALPIGGEGYLKFAAAAFPPALIALLVTVILNAMMIWSCYMWICLPEDLDMKRKKTGIAWLDRIEDKLEADEEKRQAEKKEELEKIFHSRQEKYREKQKRKKK